MGGDEFGVLVKNCDLELSHEIAERTRLSIHEQPFLYDGRSLGISVSIGIAQITSATSAEEALRAADVACNMAKERGRNRTQVYQSGDLEIAQRVGEMG